MGLSPEDVGRMTLSEIEALAARFSNAVTLIKDAQALLGSPVNGATGPQLPVQSQTPVNRIPPPTPEQQQALDEWRHSSARAKLLEQIKPDVGIPGVPSDG